MNGALPHGFGFRNLTPVFDTADFTLNAAPVPDGLRGFQAQANAPGRRRRVPIESCSTWTMPSPPRTRIRPAILVAAGPGGDPAPGRSPRTDGLRWILPAATASLPAKPGAVTMKLPPLNPLRAFEAAARHGSLILAAEELCVTPGAISRQVKALEEHFGFPLFVRVHNGIEVTPEARGLQRSLHAAFLLIEKSTKDLVGTKRDGPINIWCSRLFMRHWLVPRLAAFQDAHPDREVNLFGGRSVEPLPSNIDVAIRWGADDFAPWPSHYLMGSNLIPVCSPAYLAAHPPLRAGRSGGAYAALFPHPA